MSQTHENRASGSPRGFKDRNKANLLCRAHLVLLAFIAILVLGEIAFERWGLSDYTWSSVWRTFLAWGVAFLVASLLFLPIANVWDFRNSDEELAADLANLPSREAEPDSGTRGSLWIAVVFSFAVLGFLILITGGVVRSPFTAIPITMLVLGQLLVGLDRPTVIPRRAHGGLHWRRVSLTAMREYWQILVVGIAFYVGLALIHPELSKCGQDSRPVELCQTASLNDGPELMSVLVVLFTLVASMVVTYMTRGFIAGPDHESSSPMESSAAASPVEAFWGANGKDLEVAEALQAELERGGGTAIASNTWAGDPIEGVRKTLRVKWVVGGSFIETETVEGHDVVPPDAPEAGARALED